MLLLVVVCCRCLFVCCVFVSVSLLVVVDGCLLFAVGLFVVQCLVFVLVLALVAIRCLFV